MMSKQLIFNASLSRDDALAYRTNNSLPAYGVIDTDRPNGYDAGKKISGIKQYIAIDTQGLPHALAVTVAITESRLPIGKGSFGRRGNGTNSQAQ